MRSLSSEVLRVGVKRETNAQLHGYRFAMLYRMCIETTPNRNQRSQNIHATSLSALEVICELSEEWSCPISCKRTPQ